jgi:hypothetical protein
MVADSPPVKEKHVKSTSGRQQKKEKEEGGILNIENETPKAINRVKCNSYNVI